MIGDLKIALLPTTNQEASSWWERFSCKIYSKSKHTHFLGGKYNITNCKEQIGWNWYKLYDGFWHDCISLKDKGNATHTLRATIISDFYQ